MKSGQAVATHIDSIVISLNCIDELCLLIKDEECLMAHFFALFFLPSFVDWNFNRQ